MIVYVESNFVLELALLQEQHRSCEQLIALTTERRIHIAIPAFSLAEPYETLTRTSRKRQAVAEEVRRELRQLGRSAPYEEQTIALEGLTGLLIKSQEEERGRLEAVLQQILGIAEIIPLTADIIRNSLHNQQRGFSPQDSVVYASVLHHIKQVPGESKVFLNRNSKDFDDPDVQDELEAQGCKVLFSFDYGLAYVQHQITQLGG